MRSQVWILLTSLLLLMTTSCNHTPIFVTVPPPPLPTMEERAAIRLADKGRLCDPEEAIILRFWHHRVADYFAGIICSQKIGEDCWDLERVDSVE